MANDKRIKICPNECRIKKKIITYKVDDSYCRKCASPLVLVCAECYGRIEDLGPKHRICERCVAKHEARKQNVKNGLKKSKNVVVAAAGAGVAVVKTVKDPKVQEAVKAGVKLIKK